MQKKGTEAIELFDMFALLFLLFLLLPSFHLARSQRPLLACMSLLFLSALGEALTRRVHI